MSDAGTAAASLARRFATEGRPAEAEILRRGVAGDASVFGHLFPIAEALERAGRIDDAIEVWSCASTLNPGHAEPFTRRGLLLLQRSLGPAQQPRALRPARGVVTMATLGRNGRFGNQLLQYGFIRSYASQHGLEIELPDWIGRYLYDLDDPILSRVLPRISEDQVDLVGSLTGRNPVAYASCDISGFFCGHSSGFAGHRNMLQQILRPGRHLHAYADSFRNALSARGSTVVAIHLRRGDFGTGRFWIAPEQWYLDWIRSIWPGLDQPVLYVASDDPAVISAFEDFRPVVANDLAVPIPGAEFFLDFHALTVADVVAISNSTFSFVASMLNAGGRLFMRPHADQAALLPYDPWNAPIVL